MLLFVEPKLEIIFAISVLLIGTVFCFLLTPMSVPDEQAHYEYKPSAWKGFLKHSGLKVGLSGMQIAAVAIIASVMVGSAVFVVLKTSSPKAGTPTVQEETTVLSDTIVPVEMPDETEQNEASQMVVQPAAIVKETKTEENAPEEVSKPNTEQQEKKNVTHPYMVPVRIDVDTITSLETTDEERRNGNSRIF